MAPVKKSKSAKNSESINSRLQLVVKSGKVSDGRLEVDAVCSREICRRIRMVDDGTCRLEENLGRGIVGGSVGAASAVTGRLQEDVGSEGNGGVEMLEGRTTGRRIAAHLVYPDYRQARGRH